MHVYIHGHHIIIKLFTSISTACKQAYEWSLMIASMDGFYNFLQHQSCKFTLVTQSMFSALYHLNWSHGARLLHTSSAIQVQSCLAEANEVHSVTISNISNVVLEHRERCKQHEGLISALTYKPADSIPCFYCLLDFH